MLAILAAATLFHPTQVARDTLRHLTLNAVVAPATGLLSATATLRFPAATTGSEFQLILARSFKVTSTSATNATVQVIDSDEPIAGMHLVTVKTTSTSPAEVRLVYEGPLAEAPDSAIPAIVADRVELNLDAFWIPYSAKIIDPFTLSGELRGIPAGWKVASSHPFVRTAGGIRFTPGLPTWDVALVATPTMREVTDGRLRFFAPDLDSPTPRRFRSYGAGSLTFLEAILGPSAYPTASVVIVRRRRDSGYARPGYIVVTEQGAGTDSAAIAKFAAHELAHGWFWRADPNSEDYWLTESPAEYLALRYVERTLGIAERDRLIAPKVRLAAQAGSVLGHGRGSDKVLYAKGPLLLFDLERQISRPALDRVLKRFAADATPTTVRFLQILGEEAGAPAASEFERILRSDQ